MRVRGEGGDEFLAKPGKQVHHPAGQVARGQHLAEYDGRVRVRRGSERNDRVAAGDGRGHQGEQPEQRRRVGRDHAHDAHRLGHGEIEVGRGHRVHIAQHLFVLVGPAGIINEPVNRGGHFAERGAVAVAPARAQGDGLRHLGGPPLQHLTQAVEDLPAVVGRAPGPARTRLGGRLDGIAQVLAGALRHIRIKGPGGVRHGKRPPALRADERAADVDLGRFGDGQAAHGVIFTTEDRRRTEFDPNSKIRIKIRPPCPVPPW